MESYNNNCILGKSEEILKTFETNSIDLVVTSPPYDNLRKYHNSLSSWNSDVFQKIAIELTRVVKDGGVIVWNVGDKVEKGSYTATSMRQALFFIDQCGLKLNDEIIWFKSNPCPTIKQLRYSPCYEKMYVFVKGDKPKTFNPILRETKTSGLVYNSTCKNIDGESGRTKKTFVINPTMIEYNVWKFAVSKNKYIYTNNEGKEIRHPAVFPIELPLRHIKSWTNEGDIVLDPFAGSGTTLLAAKELNRQFIGIEQNEDYYQMIKQRLELC